ncbi:unnamed protein product [Closterium sp. Naga37s-1]|nr:unnamed protein product [Closterium sp. Naga37s-1]
MASALAMCSDRAAWHNAAWRSAACLAQCCVAQCCLPGAVLPGAVLPAWRSAAWRSASWSTDIRLPHLPTLISTSRQADPHHPPHAAPHINAVPRLTCAVPRLICAAAHEVRSRGGPQQRVKSRHHGALPAHHARAARAPQLRQSGADAGEEEEQEEERRHNGD